MSIQKASRSRFWTSLCAGAFGVLAGLSAGCGGSDPPAEQRQTRYGTVLGTDLSSTQGVLSWKGLPYAKSPTGALRWRAPAEPDAWAGVRLAQQYGHACAQFGRIFGPGANNTYDATIGTTLNTPVGHEDCLTLNVWTPSAVTTKLPVIVFVHGGSNVSGYSADPVYDGAALAKAANAVVVTLNYRLGVFGFFNHPALKTGVPAEDSGNFALLDIAQALRFVRDNIDAFNGDAGNVTLMGQSAGAINTWALMAAPQAKGLFHKAIPLSGGISLASNLPAGSIPTINPASAYLAQANALTGHLMVADGLAADLTAATARAATQTSAQLADYLRGKSADAVLRTVVGKGLTSSGPIPDGVYLPTDPIAAMAAGNHAKVPVLAGITAQEGKLFARLLPLLGGPSGWKINDADLFNTMRLFDGDKPQTLSSADIIDPAYLPVNTPTTGYNAKTGALGAGFLGRARDNVLNTLATQQNNVWLYQFNWAQEPAPWNDVYGAAHAFDLPFLFGNFGPSLYGSVIANSANRPGRLALSGQMMATLGAFVRNGNPNHTGLGVTWEPWPKRLNFDANLTQAQLSVQ